MGAFALAACSGGSSFSVAPNADRNILLVTIDTLRADALGAYGGRAATPNLDRLAAHGARFDFAHAHAVVTLASHASILTGTYPYEHGVRDNTGYRLDRTTSTVASIMQAAGFSTGAFVGGFPLDRRFGLAGGFRVYDDKMTRASATGEVADRERPADAVVKAATDWMNAQQGKWFAWVHVYDPHEPYESPGEYATRFPGEPYLGEVSWTDSALGPLFDQLRGSSRGTFVVVTGDHGESLGEHGERTHSLFAYEPTLRVPLIVSELGPSGRGDSAKGRVIETPVRHIDILPTVMAAAGLKPGQYPGSALFDVINAGGGPDRPSYFEAMSAAVTRGWAPLRGAIVGREKYIDLPIVELYDVAADPKEASNLAQSRRDRARVMLETLKQFNVAPPARAGQETAETVERLRSLGYIGGGSAAVREHYTEADDPKRLVEIEQLLTQGNEAFRANRVDEAIGIYRSIITKRPDTEDAYRKLALAYWRTNRPALAIATLESALRAGITQSEVRIKLGEYLAQSGQASKAIDLLKDTARSDPDALIALGNAYTVAGRFGEAAATFRRILAAEPNHALALQDLGIVQLQTKDLRNAEASLRRAVQLDQTLGGAYTALGVLFATTGRKAEAIDAWQRGAALGDANAADNLRAIR